MVSNMIHIDNLRTHLDNAKEKLSLEKIDILKLNPLEDNFNREAYAFAYVRAERLGMRAINRRLAEIAWLPMQLDPKAEIMSDNRASMKRWLTSAFVGKPDSDIFGNDFIHALARCATRHNWDHPEFVRLSARIANLFRDLSCLIGVLYYCTWLTENNVLELPITRPEDLSRTAEEIATLIQSPELYRSLRAKEQDDEKNHKAKKTLPKPAKTSRPVLRVIENDNHFDPFMPDPVSV